MKNFQIQYDSACASIKLDRNVIFKKKLYSKYYFLIYTHIPNCNN